MKHPTTQFALCLDNAGNEASLICGKVYRVLPDTGGAKDDLVRVVDESGEDYLFARSQFAIVEFPQAVRRKLLALQKTG
jgi:2-C-methyl-D-erythritol 4-phosphate cytidylyltransferase